MTTCYVTRRWTIKLLHLPKHPLVRRQEQPDDPQPTPDETRAVLLLLKRTVDLILSGEESIRDLITPSGGWDRLDQEDPKFKMLPVEAQLRFVLHR